MEYRVLGRSGLDVSRVCLGTMTFGAKVDEAESIEIIHRALDWGVNFIDTANIYVGGRSEEIVGKALAGRRDDVVLASKCSGALSDTPNSGGLSRTSIIRNVDASLARLGTDYLDILFLHFPDGKTGFEEIVQTMGMLVRSGKVRYWGMSNFAAWKCCSLVHLAREASLPGPVVSQNVYNIVTRGLDDELLTFLEEYKLGLVTFNPLAGGLLTGKHAHGRAAEGSRLADDKGYALRYLRPASIEAADRVAELAAEMGATPVRLAYQWLLGKDYITSILCGVSGMTQLEDNLSACDAAPLPADVVAQLDALWDSIKGDYFNYHHDRPLFPPPAHK